MKRLTLPKKKRLSSNEEFKNIIANGRCAHNGVLVLYMLKNCHSYSRLGVSVGKIHGNAVVRNRLKRLLREVFRQNQQRIPDNFDYLLMYSRKKLNEKQPAFAQVEKSFLTLVDIISKSNTSKND